jgi:hypothetical protein
VYLCRPLLIHALCIPPLHAWTADGHARVVFAPWFRRRCRRPCLTCSILPEILSQQRPPRQAILSRTEALRTTTGEGHSAPHQRLVRGGPQGSHRALGARRAKFDFFLHVRILPAISLGATNPLLSYRYCFPQMLAAECPFRPDLPQLVAGNTVWSDEAEATWPRLCVIYHLRPVGYVPTNELLFTV